MAAEFAPHNIRVNAFSPGVIKTNMTNSSIEKSSQKLLAAISLNRFGKVEEVAKVVLFLASEQSSYITGINLDISGGKLIVQNPSLAWNK
jgi:NAD(P)-dependent dehydrogenase (short-subunit alcohol dehydrogenase family)